METQINLSLTLIAWAGSHYQKHSHKAFYDEVAFSYALTLYCSALP